jgi:O-antigen/teichoic acid export membrane protein
VSEAAADARRAAYNTAVQAAGKVVLLGIGAGSVAVATRYLGSSGYGQFALALAYVQMFGVLADVGLLTIAVREIARAPERAAELAGNAIVLRLLLAFAVFGIAALVSLALPYDEHVRVAILIAAVASTFGLLNGAIVAVLQARLQMDRATAADVAGRAAAFGALVAVVEMDLGFYAVVWTAAIGAAVTLVFTLVLSRGIVAIRPAADRRVWHELLVASLPLGVTLAVTEIYFRADMFIISLFRDFGEVGAYAVAYRILELVAVFPAVLMTSVFPLLSRYLDESRALAERTVDAAGDVLVAFGLPLAAGALVLAPEVVRLVAGDGFAEAEDPLRLLMVAGAMAFVSGLFGFALIAARQQRSALWIALAGLGVNLALNLALVPSLGIDAAAAVAVASEVVMLAGGFVLVRRHLGFVPRFALLGRAALAAAAMALLVWLIRDLPTVLVIPIGAVAYLAALVALGGVDRSRLEALRA